MQPSEILEAPSVSTLTRMLISKSPLLHNDIPVVREGSSLHMSSDGAENSHLNATERDAIDQNGGISRSSFSEDSGVGMQSAPLRLMSQMLDDFLRAASCISKSQEDLGSLQRPGV